MKTKYYSKRFGMTYDAMTAVEFGCTAYRTRLECECEEGRNRRDGILLTANDVVICKLVRCKACAKKEAQNGKV
jgi:hypothetical protein